MAFILRFPKPQSFLHIISLRTAVELITLTLLVNKATGAYGILAIFTGYHLNPLQLSHYVYSLITLALVGWLSPSIKRNDQPLQNIALAWIYVIDTVINSVYTALFGMGWFVVLAQSLSNNSPVGPGDVSNTPGADMIDDTAGFTSPQFNATGVSVVAKPIPGILPGQQAIAYGHTYGSLGDAFYQSGSMASLTVLGLLWIIRTYFCIIYMSFARSVLRSYIVRTSHSFSQPEDATMAESPFREDRGEGAGWKGKLGRFMIRFPTRRYWLGKDENEDEWVRATSGRFEAGKVATLRIKTPERGVSERERRARSGTGPPPPPPPLNTSKGKE